MTGDPSPAQLEEVLSRTLEDAAFVFFESSDGGAAFEEPLIEASLRYGAGQDRELRLAIPETLASTLAANMLGEEEGGAAVTGDDADAVGELLNMIAGALAAELFGSDAQCPLGIPCVRRIDPAVHEQRRSAAVATVTLFDEEGKRVDLSALRVRGEPR